VDFALVIGIVFVPAAVIVWCIKLGIVSEVIAQFGYTFAGEHAEHQALIVAELCDPSSARRARILAKKRGKKKERKKCVVRTWWCLSAERDEIVTLVEWLNARQAEVCQFWTLPEQFVDALQHVSRGWRDDETGRPTRMEICVQ
jgi:hypothetical protein